MRYFKLIVLILCFQLTKSQNFYVETNNGYGIPFMKVFLGYKVDTSNFTQMNYGTYGGGANFNIGGGYMFNDNIGLELMFNYVHGKTTLTNDLRKGFTEYRTDFARMFMATPMFVAKSNAEKWNIIGKLGAVLPLGGGQITEAFLSSKDLQNPTVDNSVYLKIKTFGKFTIGTLLSLGIEYNLTEKMALTLETQALLLHVKSKKSKVLAYKVYGEDKYNEWEELGNTYETTFVDSYNSLNKGEAQSQISSYSALRFNLGFKFYINR